MQRHEPRPLTWWCSRRHDIDFDPIYQRRGRIWTREAKALLVDSILNGYDIPKVYVADFTIADSPLNPNKKMYAIIDGKQRFEAVFDFFDDELALSRDFVYDRNPSLDLKGLRYSELRSQHPEVSELFDRYELDVMSVVTDKKGKIEELFIRLNKNSAPLTGAEVRNAMPGIVPILTRALAKHPFFESKIRFTTKRFQDLNAAIKLLLIEYKGKLVSTKKGDLDAFTKGVKVAAGPDTEPHREAAARVRGVLDAMASIFSDRDRLLSSSGIVPVYYWLVRNHGRKHRGSIRPFLQQFEQRRTENDRRAEERAAGVKEELLEYSRNRRSPNDQGAQMRLYEVLERGFDEFLKALTMSEVRSTSREEQSGRGKH